VEGAVASYQRTTFTSIRPTVTVPLQPTNIPAEVFLIRRNVDETFKVEMLSKFIRDKVGQLCSSEPTMVSFRQQMFMKTGRKGTKKPK